jgi:hypothetical protein
MGYAIRDGSHSRQGDGTRRSWFFALQKTKGASINSFDDMYVPINKPLDANA